MATIGHSTHVDGAALQGRPPRPRYCETTTESLDDVISTAQVAAASAGGPVGFGGAFTQRAELAA